MDRIALIAQLRQLADLLERRADIPTPFSTIVMTAFLDGTHGEQKQKLGELAHEFAPVEKNYGPWHAGIKLINNDEMHFTIFANREAVCRKKVETKLVPARVIPAHEEVVIPEHEETVETWDCEPMLAEIGA